MGKSGRILLSGIAVALLVLLVWIFRPHPQQPCAFSGWKQTVGVELDAQVKDLEAVKAKLGVTDSQVREFDTLMRDYALKYDAACQDVRAGTMTRDEYTCLRNNMDGVLDEIRRFVTATEQAKGVADPATQRKVVLEAFQNLRAASSSKYRSGCASALDVNPKKISFAGLIPERSVQITNRGNNDLTFSVDGLPEAFDPKPNSGLLPRASTASIAIKRTILPLPGTQPLKFHVRSNLQDDEEVEIAVDAQSGALWKSLAQEAAAVANASPVDAALKVVDRHIAPDSAASKADRYVLASCVLVTMRQNEAAQSALRAAIQEDASVAAQPSNLILTGILAERQGRTTDALAKFDEAKDKAGSKDLLSGSLAELFKGTILSMKGDNAGATRVLQDPTKRKFVLQNPSLSDFVSRELCPTGICAATLLNSLKDCPGCA